MHRPHPLTAEQRQYLALFGEDDLWVAPDFSIQPAQVVPTEPRAAPRAPHPQPTTVAAAASAPARTAPPPAARAPALVAPVPQRSSAQLDAIRTQMGDCRLCRLCEGRQRIVFGEGNPSARVLFVGEGPGADEDSSGRPFVGRAGRLLTDIIEKGMQLSRGEVYIANVVKCRPPANRDPEPDEIAQCLPYLQSQIAAVQPDVLVVLGKSAARGLLGHEGPMSRIRGQWQSYSLGERTIPVMPTWHPSYLLRTPEAKRETWQDIKQVLAKLGLPYG